jgi:hypothetical protein
MVKMGVKEDDSEDEEYDEEDIPIEQRASYKWVQRSIETDPSC